MSCNYRANFLESESFATGFHVLSVFEAPLHIFGIYIILKKTPKIMEKMKFPIIVLHLIGAWCDIFVSILVNPFLLFPATAGYALGPLYYVMPTCLMAYLGFSSFCLLGPSLTLLFENRYNLLVREDSESPSRKVKRFFHHLFNVLFTILVLVPPFTNPIDIPNFREILHHQYPCLPEQVIQHPRLYYLNTDPIIAFLNLLFSILSSFIQIIMFLIATSVYLFKTSEFRSSRTTRLQKQLFKAMCIQTCLPFIVLIFPAAYFLYVFASGFLDLGFNNLCVLSFTSHGTFSTIVMLIVHEPYRSATLQIIGFCKIPIPARSYLTSWVSKIITPKPARVVTN